MTETTLDPQIAVQDAIIKTLSQPKKIESEAGSVEQHSVSELLEMDKYLAQKKASKAGMKFLKINSQ